MRKLLGAILFASLVLAGLAEAAPSEQPVTPSPSPSAAPVPGQPTPTPGTARPTFLPGQPPVPVTTSSVSACGTLTEALGGPVGDPMYLLAVTTSAGDRIRFRLSHGGSAPLDLVTHFMRGIPQTVRVSGVQTVANSATPDAISLTSFTVARVISCTLPATSTR